MNDDDPPPPWCPRCHRLVIEREVIKGGRMVTLQYSRTDGRLHRLECEGERPKPIEGFGAHRAIYKRLFGEGH